MTARSCILALLRKENGLSTGEIKDRLPQFAVSTIAGNLTNMKKDGVIYQEKNLFYLSGKGGVEEERGGGAVSTAPTTSVDPNAQFAAQNIGVIIRDARTGKPLFSIVFPPFMVVHTPIVIDTNVDTFDRKADGFEAGNVTNYHPGKRAISRHFTHMRTDQLGPADDNY